MKAIQTFSNEYLEECKSMTPKQILQFLEDFRLLHGSKPGAAKSKLISMKVPTPLLAAFKTQCKLHNTPYQTQIKKLMTKWLDTTK